MSGTCHIVESVRPVKHLDDAYFSNLHVGDRVRRTIGASAEGTITDGFVCKGGDFGSITVQWDNGKSSLFFFDLAAP